MKRIGIALILALLGAVSYGQEVVLSSGNVSEKDFELGEAVVFETPPIPAGAEVKGGSPTPKFSCTATKWELREFPGKTFALWSTSGNYEFELSILWGLRADDGVLWKDFGLIDFYEKGKVGKGGDDPNPPPPPPAGDIAQTAAQLVSQVAGDSVAAEAQSLAAVYQKLAAEIETASDPLSDTKLVTREAALDALAREASAILGGRRDAWQVWFDGMKTFMDKHFQQGKLPNTVFGIGEGFAEISNGLQAVR